MRIKPTAPIVIHVHMPPPAPIDQRAECWMRAFAGIVSAIDCKEFNVAINWADAAVAAFDKRFGSPRGIAAPSTNPNEE
jgi:hypothetical protein